MMSSHGAAPVPERFNLGPDGFIVRARFVLAAGDWKTSLGYCKRLATISIGDISFSDVRLYITNLQEGALSWVKNAYPSEIVSLASAVVHYARVAAGVYYPPLAQTLAVLGADPTNGEFLQQVNAIIQALDKTAGEQSKAALEAALAAERFVNGAAAGEKRLRPLFDAYSSIYLPHTADVQSTPSQDLSLVVAALGQAWKRLSDELGRLKSFVDTKTAAGQFFSTDIAAPDAVALWKTTGDAADKWRLEAFID
jgi:hypothetical protein